MSESTDLNKAVSAALKRIQELEVVLADMTTRVENSWERRDLAPDSDLDAVKYARQILKD